MGFCYTDSNVNDKDLVYLFFFFFLENPLGRRFDFYLNRASTQCKHFVIVGSVSFSIVSDSLGPMDCSLPGSVMELIHEILQARILEWLLPNVSESPGATSPIETLILYFQPPKLKLSISII